MKELTVKEYLRKKKEAEIAINLAIKVIIDDFKKATGLPITGISHELYLHHSAKHGSIDHTAKPDKVVIISTQLSTLLED